MPTLEERVARLEQEAGLTCDCGDCDECGYATVPEVERLRARVEELQNRCDFFDKRTAAWMSQCHSAEEQRNALRAEVDAFREAARRQVPEAINAVPRDMRDAIVEELRDTAGAKDLKIRTLEGLLARANTKIESLTTTIEFARRLNAQLKNKKEG